MTPLAKPIVAPVADPILRPSECDSLFEQFDWLYILCRERLFRDDTVRMIAALWQNGRPARGAKLVELGCGPGFYSRNLAARFPELQVRGLDRSRRQLAYARNKAADLANCRFDFGDVRDLIRPEQSCDYIVASRLFTVLREPELAVAEMFRVLVSGGRCFIAEPRYRFWASIPLFMMRAVARASGLARECGEPKTAQVMATAKLECLFRDQPWREVRVWRDGRYHYALCEKG